MMYNVHYTLRVGIVRTTPSTPIYTRTLYTQINNNIIPTIILYCVIINIMVSSKPVYIRIKN